MGEDMIEAAEEALARQRVIHELAKEETDKNEYASYLIEYFENTFKAVEFLNTNHIPRGDVVALNVGDFGPDIKPDGTVSSTNRCCELVFYNRVISEKYFIREERWWRSNPALLKEIVELSSFDDKQTAKERFKDLIRYKPKYHDKYRHVYALHQQIIWSIGMSDACIARSSDSNYDNMDMVIEAMKTKPKLVVKTK